MKPKIFKSKFSDMEIEISEGGWASIEQHRETITLGNYPNARWELIEKALEYVKSKENES